LYFLVTWQEFHGTIYREPFILFFIIQFSERFASACFPLFTKAYVKHAWDYNSAFIIIQRINLFDVNDNSHQIFLEYRIN